MINKETFVMKKSLIAFVLLLLFAEMALCQEKMEIEGAIIINNSEDASPAPGTIRFNPTINDFEGWNSVTWVSLTGIQYLIDEMTDQDGNTYPTVTIGRQEWMATNLKVTKYQNGSAIVLIDNDAAGNTAWSTADYGAYAVFDTTSTGYSFDLERFGYIYNWYAVHDGRGLCPSGWHVPSDEEWTTLIDYLGGSEIAGGKMKETGTTHWYSPNIGATNESGFTGLPSGFRNISGSFNELGFAGFLWCSTDTDSSRARFSYLNFLDDNVDRFSNDKRYGFSVRCVKD